MVDAISQKIVTQIGEQAQQAPGRSTVSSGDAAEFSSMVNGGGQTGQPDSNVTQMQATEHTAQATAQQPVQGARRPSMGDRILGKLEGVGQDMQSARQKMVENVGDGKMAEMYKMQLDVAQITTTQTVLGQVGSKTNQGVQTLLKGQ